MATSIKYQENTCDFCFKMSAHSEVHRCKQCLTKIYCSKECQLGDWELVHKEICKGKGEKRKRKGGAVERREKGNRGARSMLECDEKRAFQNHVVQRGDVEGYVNYTRMIQDLKDAL